MKHRWLPGLLLALALALVACTPAEREAGPAAPARAPADFYDDY